jgi:hypothetical protein
MLGSVVPLPPAGGRLSAVGGGRGCAHDNETAELDVEFSYRMKKDRVQVSSARPNVDLVVPDFSSSTVELIG